ncbi:MAG: AgmX/PglI C-terminal domain-containing protein [Myxococcales bacterium]|nr:AgmX/PglI C-terminal domain-containing protein [Myxococcales bacterium]
MFAWRDNCFRCAVFKPACERVRKKLYTKWCRAWCPTNPAVLNGFQTRINRLAAEAVREAWRKARGKGQLRLSAFKRGRCRRAVRVSVLTMQLSGALPERVVRRGIERNTRAVALCYARSPELQSTMTLRYTISGAGNVGGATTIATAKANAKVAKCISRAAAKWRFPAHPGGAKTTVKATLRLARD